MEQLPDLPAVTRLSPRVIRILGGNPSKFTLQGTNTYLLGTGHNRLLLDTGEGNPIWKTTLQKVLKDENARIEKVILTHWHHDHIGGIEDVKDVAGSDVPIFKNQRETSVGTNFEDGEIFKVEGAKIRALHSPGHTVDHMCFILEDEDAMFTGDNVLGHGTAVFEDLAAYMSSLHRMETQFNGRAYPSHGEVIEDGREKIRGYISHREAREKEALELLGRKREDGKDGWESMEMVKVIYKAYPEQYHLPAQGSLGHVLRKLEADGKVREREGRWSLAEKAAL